MTFSGRKSFIFSFALLCVIAVPLILTTCDTPFGFGETIDLEPPILIVQSIELPDGEIITVQKEDGNKLFIGRGILAGNNSILSGIAYDNISVENILVEELNGSGRWNNAAVSAKDGAGWQNWTITLNNLQKGERVLRISAQDKPENIGPDTVAQLTLLVDTDEPFVKNPIIERRNGFPVNLMSKDRLEELDPYEFDNIDYFQNEEFSVRANIEHEYPLSDVWLNFVEIVYNEQNGRYEEIELFDSTLKPGLERSRGTVLTPVWDIDESQIIAANPKYASGKYYFNVVITARARAGNSGQNKDISNLLYNLCWWPEADYPRATVTLPRVTIPGGLLGYEVEKGGVLPVQVFDDDNIGEIYSAVIPIGLWNDPLEMPGSTDEEKLARFYDPEERENFAVNDYPEAGLSDTDLANKYPLKKNRFPSGVVKRSETLAIDTGSNRGESRLIVIAKDKKDTGKEEKWGNVVIPIFVWDEGTPMILVSEPLSGSIPTLVNEEYFTLKGIVQNIDLVDVLKVAWISSDIPTNVQVSRAETALKTQNTSPVYTVNGIKVWNLALTELDDEFLGGRWIKQQEFTHSFDVLTDFNFQTKNEDEAKFMIIYTKGVGENGVDVYNSIRLLPFTSKPVINVAIPTIFGEYRPGANINFDVRVRSPSGVPITTWSMQRTAPLPATAVNFTSNASYTDGDGISWTRLRVQQTIPATDSIGTWSYLVTVKDRFGNEQTQEIIFSVENLPTLSTIIPDSAYSTGQYFSSRNFIDIHAEFARPVTVNTSTGKPRLRLTGITTSPANQPRYAVYDRGTGSNRLTFRYEAQEGDFTTGTIGVDAIDLSQLDSYDDISADFTNLVTGGNLPANRIILLNNAAGTAAVAPVGVAALKVDGRAPTISGITTAVIQNDTAYPDWLRAGHVFEISLDMDKPVMVLGNPRLNITLQNPRGVANNEIVPALYNRIENNDQRLVFRYTVNSGDEAEPVIISRVDSFTPAYCRIIVDKVGTDGNYLYHANPSGASYTSGIKIDAVPPAKLILNRLTWNVAQQRRYQIQTAEIEDGAKVEYTLDGQNWNNATAPYYIDAFVATAYAIQARQTDRAGNVGPLSDSEVFDLSSIVNFSSVGVVEPNKVYGIGESLTFKLNFNGGKVYTNGAVSITVGNAANATGANTRVLNFTNGNGLLTQANADYSLTYRWNPIAEGIDWTKMYITAINIAGVISDLGVQVSASNIDITNIRDTFNGNRDIGILTVKPQVSNIGASASGNATVTTQTPANMHQIVAAPKTVAPNVGKTEIAITFNHAVTPGNGYITVRPANGWYIPPVLSNDDYGSVDKALAGTDYVNENASNYPNSLPVNYIETTHGLIEGTGSPDVTTKYVLRFDRGISGNGEPVATLRSAFNEAEYMWQKVSSSQLSITGSVVTIALDPLPGGRQWRIVIDEGAFIDAAGNTNDRWSEQSDTTTGTIATTGYFWSQTVATPVIRLERVSSNMTGTLNNTNNNSTSPVENTNNMATTANYWNNKGTANERVSRITARYRVDCETPGAVIQAGIWNRGTPANTTTVPNRRGVGAGVATITTAQVYNEDFPNTSNGNQTGITVYRAYPQAVNGLHNSDITDATPTELQGIQLAANYQNTYNQTTNFPQVGTTPTGNGAQTTGPAGTNADLYTARKDYIAATATKALINNGNGAGPALNGANGTAGAASARGYEGAFKTLLVFRNPRINAYRADRSLVWASDGVDNAENNPDGVNGHTNNNNDPGGRGLIAGWSVKVEATNTQSGAVTISGFPMSFNDVSGKSSKHMYEYSPATGIDDRIFISWEIVCDFWQVFMGVGNNNPNSQLRTGGYPDFNAWDLWPELYYRHMYRRYGNWGLFLERYPAKTTGNWWDPGFDNNYPIAPSQP